jgi:hypothetical protein
LCIICVLYLYFIEWVKKGGVEWSGVKGRGKKGFKKKKGVQGDKKKR